MKYQNEGWVMGLVQEQLIWLNQLPPFAASNIRTQ